MWSPLHQVTDAMNVWDSPEQFGAMVVLSKQYSEKLGYAAVSYGRIGRLIGLHRRSVITLMQALEVEKEAVQNIGTVGIGPKTRCRWVLTLDRAFMKVREQAGVGPTCPFHKLPRRYRKRKAGRQPRFSPFARKVYQAPSRADLFEVRDGDPGSPSGNFDTRSDGDPGSPSGPRDGDPGSPSGPRDGDPGSPQSAPEYKEDADTNKEEDRTPSASAAAQPRMPFPPKLATPPPHQAKVEARRDYLYRQLQNRVAGLARSLLKSRRGAPPSYEALVTATEALCVKHRVIGYDHVLRSICLSLWHREHTQFGGFR